MSHYDFSHSVDRADCRSEKWSRKNIAQVCGNEDALPFWVADMDLRACDEITSALEEENRRAVYGYRENSRLTENFISFMKARHSTDLREENIAASQGMLHSIALALNLFTKEGDRILIPFPSYHPFFDMVKANGRVVVPYYMDLTDKGFVFDWEKLKETGRTCQAILFCSPHNPTGTVFSEAELRAVLETARERDQLVLCDEIHSDLTYPQYRHTPMYKANLGIGARAITFCAPSKSFNIAGEHCAFALFSHSGLRDSFIEMQKRLYLSTIGYSAAVMAEAAYSKGLDFNRALCQALSSKADRVENYLKENCPLLTFDKPHASFVGLIDCRKIFDRVLADSRSHSELYDGERNILSHFFGQRGGICMNDGTDFGSRDFAPFVRFNFGCGDDLLEKGLSLIKKAYDWALSAD